MLKRNSQFPAKYQCWQRAALGALGIEEVAHTYTNDCFESAVALRPKALPGTRRLPDWWRQVFWSARTSSSCRSGWLCSRRKLWTACDAQMQAHAWGFAATHRGSSSVSFLEPGAMSSAQHPSVTCSTACLCCWSRRNLAAFEILDSHFERRYEYVRTYLVPVWDVYDVQVSTTCDPHLYKYIRAIISRYFVQPGIIVILLADCPET